MQRISAMLPAGQGDLAIHRGARRASRRFPFHADVELVEPAGGTGTTLNASVGGVRMILDRELAAGDEATVRITTPQRESLERVRVVWTRALPDGWLVGCAWAR